MAFAKRQFYSFVHNWKLLGTNENKYTINIELQYSNLTLRKVNLVKSKVLHNDHCNSRSLLVWSDHLV